MNDERSLLRVDAFDYELPPELIAQEPLARRDASRLLVVDGDTGRIAHSTIADLPLQLDRGDLLVANNTRVLPARIFTRKEVTGGRVELLLLHRDPSGNWTCLAKPAKSVRVGTTLLVDRRDGKCAVAITVIERRGEGEVVVAFDNGDDAVLEQIGTVPLPPYIRTKLEQAERYQTTYARVSGSAAAPTAGLHMTDELRGRLAEAGVGWVEVTLHIGLDTFRPVTVERVGEHPIHREWCSLPAETAQAILRTMAEGGRVVAVGTTSARTIESWGAFAAKAPQGYEGWSDLFITPGYQWTVLDGMLTNFHLPRSTLLMMVSAFVGRETVGRAYDEAIRERYRFYSFGDASLLWRRHEGRPTSLPTR